VEAVDDKKEPQTWTVKGEQFRRDKTIFSKEKTKLFLKQNVEGFNAMLKVKESSHQKYVVDRELTMEKLFVGKLPSFEMSKKLQQQEKVKKEKKEKTPKSKKSAKNGDITKYLNSSGSSSKQLSSVEKKKREEDSIKFREEMEAKRKEKADQEAEKQKKIQEERARLLAKIQAAVREHNHVKDDLELCDHKVLPKGQLISTLVDKKYFSDFVKLLEFLHSFPEVLSISDKFPFGITIEIMERALILKEVNGPLSDIFQVLLGTVFSMQIEEENEVDVKYTISGDATMKHSKLEQMIKAAKVHMWSQKHFCTKINEMAMDSTTLSELLRLHFMGSGAMVAEWTSKYRFAARGGYRSHDDPGFEFTIKYPHIIKFLSQYNVFQLSTGDILKILGCLIDQILTFTNLRDVLEERLEKAASAKMEYRSIKINEGKRERKVLEEKKQLQEELKTAIAAFPEDKKEELTKKAEKELEEKFAKIDAQAVKERAQHLKELSAQVAVFFNHQTYLGSDRAFRNYYVFESIPGLFVEHDITFSGKCLDKLVKNNPALAHCTKDQRYTIIKQMVTSEESGNDDKENKIEINGAAQEKTGAIKKDDIQRDLFMCNCDPTTCIVHSDTPERVTWTYFHTAEEVDALIQSLNVRGYREKNLKDQLEASRDLIVDYIKNCPVEKLSVEMDDEEKIEEVKKSLKKNKKYENANLNHLRGTDPNVIFDAILREVLLDFETKINFGCLGELKVSDRMMWRKYIEDLSYASLDDDLKWGTERHVLNGLTNGHAEENGDGEKSEAGDSVKTASSIVELEMDSGNCSEMDSDTGDGVKMKTSDMEAVKLKVKNLAMALLQIEQGIDIKFIRSPFGPKKELKDKDQMALELNKCKKRLLLWETSLMKSTSYAQVSKN
jgi:bromodomain adjacent to zinc finger domain protein 1A